MAYKPSMRRHLKIQEIPLDIRPVMNLMVVLIPLLLSSAVFTKLAIQELNLPPAKGGTGTGTEKPTEEEKRLELKVLISKRGFYIGSRAGYLTGEANTEADPAVPLNPDGSYDFKTLQQKLIEIKEKIAGMGFTDEKMVIISAEADIAYKHIVKAIDYISTYTDEEGREQELFPAIAIGQILM
ncbi:MAG: hypothetical protein GXO78_01465 [Calditrichaeota bacterium]|nr:hypothetical protein [Calditrichota bacterium]